MFEGCFFYLKGFGWKGKKQISDDITSRGGTISFILTNTTTHIIVNDNEMKEYPSYLIPKQFIKKIKVVTADFIYHSIDAGSLAALEFYRIKLDTENNQTNLTNFFSSFETEKKKIKNEKITNFEGSSGGRAMKIFICSTFKDMRKERALIRKRIVHKLTNLCEQRLVQLSVIDLSWGVSDQMVGDGNLIQYCLEQVENCQPYFLCFLGERYGWYQDKNTKKIDKILEKNLNTAKERFDWIGDFMDRSITELEIRQAFSSDNIQPIVYMRDSAYSKRKKFFAESENAENMQNNLKHFVKEKFPDRIRDYSSTKDLNKIIEDDLKNLIDTNFPLSSTPNPVKFERVKNDQFIKMESGKYIDFDNNFQQMEEYLNNWIYEPLYIHGGLGTGKTSLLASFIHSIKVKYQNRLLISHFIGLSTENSHIYIMWRIMNEIRDKLNLLTYQVPKLSESESIQEQFPLYLEKIANQHGIVIFIDNIDELLDFASSKRFHWLPNRLSNHIKFIFTGKSEETLRFAEEKGWEILQVRSQLKKAEKREFIEKHLAFYNKNFDSEEFELLEANKLCKNPLFLSSVIVELIQIGTYENLIELVRDYLSSASFVDLYIKIIERMQIQFSSKKEKLKNLIPRFFAYILLSRDGRSALELESILKIKNSTFASILSAAQAFLIKKNQFYYISRDPMKEAISRLFLQSNAAVVEHTNTLIEYLMQIPGWSIRKMKELPHLLMKVQRKSELIQVLLDTNVIQYYISDDILKYEYINYWKFALHPEEISSSLSLYRHFSTLLRTDLALSASTLNGSNFAHGELTNAAEAQERLENDVYVRNSNFYFNIGELFKEIGQYLRGIEFYQAAIAEIERHKEHQSILLGKFYDGLSYCHKEIGDFQAAHSHSVKALEHLEQYLKENKGLSENEVNYYYSLETLLLINLSSIYVKSCDYPKAEAVAARSVEISKLIEKSYPILRGRSLNAIAVAIKVQSRFYEAQPYFLESLELKKKIFGEFHTQVADTYNDLGNLSKRLGRFDDAEGYYQKSLEIYKSIFGNVNGDVASITYNYANFCIDTGRYEQAFAYFAEAHEILRLLFPDPAILANHPLTRKIELRTNHCLNLFDLFDSVFTRAAANIHSLAASINYKIKLSKKVDVIKSVLEDIYHPTAAPPRTTSVSTASSTLKKPSSFATLFALKMLGNAAPTPQEQPVSSAASVGWIKDNLVTNTNLNDFDYDEDEDEDMGFGLFD